jgi:adenosylcobinamide-GDP ribazoletransferase
LVGVVVGGTAGTLAWLCSLVLPSMLAAVVAFAAGIVLSGAIHLDGFLDACDALFASVSPERRLAILKDPHHGSYALAGLAIVTPAWIAALAVLPPSSWPWSLAFCAGTARAAALLNAFRLRYVPGGSSAQAFASGPSVASLASGALAAAACCWAHPRLALLALPAFASAVLLGAWCARRLGGVLSGDCYGAIVVVLEVGLLGAVAAILA